MRIRRKSNSCLNCGFTLDSVYNYCPNCGQDNNDNNVSFNNLVGDFFSTYFSFDSKFVHSFKPFFIKPGELTLQYITGKRVHYAHPLRLYLIISLFYFFVFTLVGKDSIKNDDESNSIVQVKRGLDDIEDLDDETVDQLYEILSSKRIRQIKKDLDGKNIEDLKKSMSKNLRTKDKVKLLQNLDSAAIKALGVDVYLKDSVVQARLALAQAEVEKAKQLKADTLTKDISLSDSITQAQPDSLTEKETKDTEKLQGESKDDDDGVIFNRIDYNLINKLKDDRKLTDQQILDSMDIGAMTSMEERIVKQTIRVMRSDEEQLAEFVLKNLPFMMLLLIPIFALVLKLLYIRRKELYIKHLIHGFHLHSFAYLFYGVSLLIMLYAIDDEDWNSLFGSISFILVSTYAYISFLRVYKQHWFKTLIKFNITGMIYLFLIFTFFMAELVISMFFY